MHGTSVAIYTEHGDGRLPLKRTVIEDSMRQGHAAWTADLDGDGSDELLIGHREPGTGEVKGPGLYVFTCDDSTGQKWTKHVIDDGGIAVEETLEGRHRFLKIILIEVDLAHQEESAVGFLAVGKLQHHFLEGLERG